MNRREAQILIKYWWVPFFGFIIAASQFSVHAQGNSVDWLQSEPLKYIGGSLLTLFLLLGIVKDKIVDELQKYISNLGPIILLGFIIYFIDVAVPSGLQWAETNLNSTFQLCIVVLYMFINTLSFALLGYLFVETLIAAAGAFRKLHRN